MSPWWGKSSSKEVKKKTKRESIFDILQRKLKNVSEEKCIIKPGGSKKHQSDAITKKGSRSFGPLTRSPSPSGHVSRCLSFAEGHYSHPLPLPGSPLPTISNANAGIILTSELERATGDPTSKRSPYSPMPEPGYVPKRGEITDVEGYIGTASVSSESSIDSGDSCDSHLVSPLASDCETGNRATINSSFSVVHKDDLAITIKRYSRAPSNPVPQLLRNSKGLSTSPKGVPLHLQIARPGGFCSAPDSSMSSPSRSPMRAFGSEQVLNSGFWTVKPYPDLASGHCSSPGSGHNSVGGDMSGQVFRPHNKCSADCSPIPSPRMTSPGPSSRIQSGAVTPLHPLAGGAAPELPKKRQQQSHRLPLPPLTITKSCPLSPTYSASATPSTPRSPARAENATSPGSRWTKGQLLGRGTFGHVYIGFNRESGEMCAMKEVTLFSDDPRSRESAKQLCQEIALLSQLQHPNIVQYYGSETVDDRLYIYLEYVSGGSIYKLVHEYGQLGELAIRNYTRQILSGLAYLHAKNTVHRDIKGANILVDPNGQIKLADFGMAKHVTGHPCPFSLKGSPYWMAPEVIKHSDGCNLAVDIWSLGCTVLEMATAKPPWSQYEGVAAMFKIGNSKELPTIPDHLSEEGKDFVMLCLQRDPVTRPSAAQLLEHPFVKISLLERRILTADASETPHAIINAARSLAIGTAKQNEYLDFEVAGIYPSISFRAGPGSSDAHTPRNISCPVSPSGSLILPSKSMHKSGRKSPSPTSSPHTASGSPTPQTCGGGAVPVHQPKQPTFSHEAVGMIHSSKSLHKNGKMSPSPASSPHTTSGSSTPQTRGGGAVPVHQPKRPTFSHEAVSMIRSSRSLHKSGRMSPSPTSSPHTASGSSTPQNYGGVAVQVHQPKQPTFSHEAAGMIHSSRPLHKSGRMSPSPTSSPHTASGSCTPQNYGGGAVQVHQPKQPAFSHEAAGMIHSSRPLHKSGRMSPSPTSSPHTGSGSSTPQTRGGGVVSFHHPKLPTFPHEAVCMKSQNGFQSNGSNVHQGSKHNQFWINRQARHAGPGMISSDNDDTLAYHNRSDVDGKSHLADCVMMRDQLRSNASLPHRPGTRRQGRMDG